MESGEAFWLTSFCGCWGVPMPIGIFFALIRKSRLQEDHDVARASVACCTIGMRRRNPRIKDAIKHSPRAIHYPHHITHKHESEVRERRQSSIPCTFATSTCERCTMMPTNSDTYGKGMVGMWLSISEQQRCHPVHLARGSLGYRP